MRGWKLSLVRLARTYRGLRNEDFGIKILRSKQAMRNFTQNAFRNNAPRKSHVNSISSNAFKTAKTKCGGILKANLGRISRMSPLRI